MTSLTPERAMKRLKMVKNQVQMTDDCLRELSSFTFDMEKVKSVVLSLRPKLYYTVSKAVEECYKDK